MFHRDGASIEEYLELCAEIFADEGGEVVDDIEIVVRLLEKPPAN